MTDDPRKELILTLTDLEHGPGLEIAPLHNPIAAKDDWDVSYVDILSTEKLIEHYHLDPKVPDEDIVPVDFPLTGPDGVIRPLPEAAGARAPYAWIIGSHVIEHVPDLVTWLDDLASLLRDGGALVLAVPDRRYTFDVRRPQTTVGQMLQAFDAKDTVPSVRAVYDQLRSAVQVTARDAWAGRLPGDDETQRHPLPAVLAEVERARAGEYVDCHVWTFRPSTFVEQVNELGRLGLCEFAVETVSTTRKNRLEFHAVLRRLPRDRTPEQDAELRAAGMQQVDDEAVARRAAAKRTAAAKRGMRLSPREKRLIERKRRTLATARRLLRR